MMGTFSIENWESLKMFSQVVTESDLTYIRHLDSKKASVTEQFRIEPMAAVQKNACFAGF